MILHNIEEKKELNQLFNVYLIAIKTYWSLIKSVWMQTPHSMEEICLVASTVKMLLQASGETSGYELQ